MQTPALEEEVEARGSVAGKDGPEFILHPGPKAGKPKDSLH
jgi:hypothetical protein